MTQGKPAPGKTILMLIPQLTYGGAERVFHDHARELAAAGHRVIECVFDSRARVDFPTQNQLLSLDVPAAGPGLLGKARALLRRAARLRALKQELAIDVCISHLEGADYLNLLSRGPEQVILCVHKTLRHDPGLAGLAGWLRRRLLMPVLYRRADQVVAVSPGLRQELLDYLRLPAARVKHISNFIAAASVRAGAAVALPPAHARWFAHGPVLVTAGRWAPEKNLPVLLPVLAGLRRASGLPVRLLLVGEGPSRPALLAAARQQGLRVWDEATAPPPEGAPADPAAYEVVLLGFQANPFAYVARAAISLLPSLAEGFSLAICEALACGVPVASADCPTGPRSILAPATPLRQYAARPEWAEFGLLLPVLRPGAPDYEIGLAAWVAALGQLLADPARRAHYAAQAARRAADFGPGPVLAQWEQLLARGRRRRA